MRDGSPHELKAFVQPELLVRGHDWNIFFKCLRDELAIERIAVMQWKTKEAEGVVGREGKNPHSKIFDRFSRRIRREAQFVQRRFDGDFC